MIVSFKLTTVKLPLVHIAAMLLAFVVPSVPRTAVVFSCWAAPPLEPDQLDKDYSEELPRSLALTPKQALEQFQISPDYRIELVACEPLVSDPVAICFDEYGAAYVVEMRGYSEDGDAHLGRVRRLQDSDGDGQYDQGTDFVEGLSWPTAVACYDRGIVVGAAPDIVYCQDADGDGVAETQEIIFSGFGRQNVQGLLNTFLWGIDHRLYGSASSNGGEIRSLRHPDRPIVTLRRQDFLINPDDGIMTSISGGGQHGMSFDCWGDRYVSANSDHVQWVAHKQRYLERNVWLVPPSPRVSIASDGPAAEVFRASPIEPWRIVRTRLRLKGIVDGLVEGGGRPAGYFTGATGVTIPSGDRFLSAIDSREETLVVVGDVGGNLVHRKRIETIGLDQTAHRIDQGREFITSTDTWFRPVQFANAPDGTLYILDMYREVIEHPLSLPPVIKQHLDLTSGRGRGRIYRVCRADALVTPRQLPGDVADAEWVGMLGHSNGWHREMASRLIVERGRKEVVMPLLRNSVSAQNDPHAIVRALYCLRELWEPMGPLQSDDIAVVHSALHHSHPMVRVHAVVLAEDPRLNRQSDIRDDLRALAWDHDSRVVRQYALSLGEFDWPDRTDQLAALANRDVSHPHQRIAIASSALRPSDLLAMLLAEPEFSAKPGAEAFITDLASQVGRREQLDEITALLGTMLQHHDPNSKSWILAMLKATGKRGEILEDWLGNSRYHGFLAEWTSAAMSNATDASAPAGARALALARLEISPITHSGVAPALQDSLSATQPPEIRDAALATILAMDSKEAHQILLAELSRLTPSARKQALNQLISRPSTALEILRQAMAGTVFQADLLPYRPTLLRHTDPEVRDMASRFLGKVDSRATVLDQYEDVLVRSGDAERGRDLFRDVCSTCHRMFGVGYEVGPDLVPLRDRGARFLLTNILDPNRELDARFESHSIIMADGTSHVGVITAESQEAITILCPNGVELSLARSEIDELRSSGNSLMPEGLESVLDREKMANLIAFLLHDE